MQFLIKCGNIRNECIHYKVKLNSIDIKKKYCKLFELYTKLHSKFFNKKYINMEYNDEIIQILQYAKGFEVFRGNEFTSKHLKQIKNDIETSQKMCCLYNEIEIRRRIKFGEEPYLLDKLIEDRAYAGANYLYTLKYCDDCLAIQGEYHSIGCDIEICPKCGKQLISCNCFDGLTREPKFDLDEISIGK